MFLQLKLRASVLYCFSTIGEDELFSRLKLCACDELFPQMKLCASV